MENKGSVVVQVLSLLIVVVVTSAIILLLVKTGILTVNVSADSEADEPILNAEFIPLAREGYLAIKDFQFCSSVSARYECISEKSAFQFGEPVHFRFVVEASTYEGEMMLVENYRLKDPLGRVILDVDEKNNFNFDLASRKKTERVAFKDFFTIHPGSPAGEYTIELVMDNPLLGKTARVTKVFEMG